MNNEADIRSALPRHIGLIMDGNGRWAAARGKARSYGHRAGVSALRSIISHCGDLGIEYVTVYAFPPRISNEARTRWERLWHCFRIFLQMILIL